MCAAALQLELVALYDLFDRPLGSVRLSVTDRCNLRCSYCMPERDYVWLPREHLLDFEEIARLARVLVSLGVRRLRLTGGEPLLRRDLAVLIGKLAAVPGLDDLALTTNGLLLAEQAEALKAAGLRRLTVSLDTLDAVRFRELTKRDALADVLAGIDAARRLSFAELKLDAVVLRGVNDDELVPLLDFACSIGAELRFIEYMDVGGATRWSATQVVARDEMLARIGAVRGAPEPLGARGSAPAERFGLPDGTSFGIIASTSAPFCRACDRARLTADGMWLQCLYANGGIDLKGALRSGADDATLAAMLRASWTARRDRGAEVRRELPERGALLPVAALRRDPHLEMHTRGG